MAGENAAELPTGSPPGNASRRRRTDSAVAAGFIWSQAESGTYLRLLPISSEAKRSPEASSRRTIPPGVWPGMVNARRVQAAQIQHIPVAECRSPVPGSDVRQKRRPGPDPHGAGIPAGRHPGNAGLHDVVRMSVSDNQINGKCVPGQGRGTAPEDRPPRPIRRPPGQPAGSRSPGTSCPDRGPQCG